MNRKEFFKKLGLGALVVAVAPKVLTKEEESPFLPLRHSLPQNLQSYKDAELIADENTEWLNEWSFSSERDYKNAMKRQYPSAYDEAVSEYTYQLNKVMYEEIWRMKL